MGVRQAGVLGGGESGQESEAVSPFNAQSPRVGVSARLARPVGATFKHLPANALLSTKACCLVCLESAHKPSCLLCVIHVIYLILRLVLFQSLKGCGGGKGTCLLSLMSRRKWLNIKMKPWREAVLGPLFLDRKSNAYIYGRCTYF